MSRPRSSVIFTSSFLALEGEDITRHGRVRVKYYTAREGEGWLELKFIVREDSKKVFDNNKKQE